MARPGTRASRTRSGRSFTKAPAALLALGLLLHGAARADGAPAPAQQVLWLAEAEVNAAKIRCETMRPYEVDQGLSTGGKVTYAANNVAHVTSPVNGRVRKVLASPGQAVQKNEPLAVLDSPDMGQARADVDKAQASLLATTEDLARQESLYRAHACSERDVEMARDAFRRARAEKGRADRKWALLGGGDTRTATGAYVLRAPLAGTVVSRNIGLGDEVQGQLDAGSSGDLFVLANLDTVWVTADVYESDLARVQPGALTYVMPDGASQLAATEAANRAPVLEGRVEWISEVLDANVRTAKVRCAYANPKHLLMPNTFVTLRIAARGRDALTLPKRSVLHISGQTFVFVANQAAKGGKLGFSLRPVQVDMDEDSKLTRVPVYHGLSLGEQVVVTGMRPLMQLYLRAADEAQP